MFNEEDLEDQQGAWLSPILCNMPIAAVAMAVILIPVELLNPQLLTTGDIAITLSAGSALLSFLLLEYGYEKLRTYFMNQEGPPSDRNVIYNK